MATIGIDASRANVENRTGTEWYIYNLLRKFKDIISTEHRVVLYTKEPLRADFGKLPVNWSNQVLRWPPKLLWTQARMSIHMLRKKNRPDLLFIPAHTIPLVHPKKTVYVAHDLGFERHEDIYSHSYIGGRLMNIAVKLMTLGKYSTNELDYHRWSMQFAIKHAAKIIAISEFTKQELQTVYNVPDTQIAVVHNGFSSEDYTPVNVDRAQPPYLLFVGRIEHKKNILNLVEAFGLLKKEYKIPHILKLAGSPGNGYEEIKERIAKYALQHDIEFTGYVPQSQMNTLMSGADVFVFPSHYEGFGIPILEALACNTLVACSDIPPLREVGGTSCNYFDKDVPKSIADTIYSVIHLRPEQKQHLQEAGQMRVKQFFWQTCANNTWQVLESVLQLS